MQNSWAKYTISSMCALCTVQCVHTVAVPAKKQQQTHRAASRARERRKNEKININCTRFRCAVICFFLLFSFHFLCVGVVATAIGRSLMQIISIYIREALAFAVSRIAPIISASRTTTQLELKREKERQRTASIANDDYFTKWQT